MLIGNDVVDLLDVESRKDALHSRFDKRVFSQRERDCIYHSSNSHRMRWSHWAAKESAYKVLKKIDARTIFSPIQYAVQLNESGIGTVRHQGRQLYLAVQSSEQYVHAISVSTIMKLPFPLPIHQSMVCNGWSFLCRRITNHQTSFLVSQTLFDSASEFLETPSSSVRRFTQKILGPLLGLPIKEIEFLRDNRIPQVRWRGFKLPIDLSLSHHGRAVAFALCYRILSNSTSNTSIP